MICQWFKKIFNNCISCLFNKTKEKNKKKLINKKPTVKKNNTPLKKVTARKNTGK